MTANELIGKTSTFSLEMITRVCPTCGTPFSIPTEYFEKLKQHQVTFYCPNGHGMWQPAKTQAEELKEKLLECENKIIELQAANIQLEDQMNKAAREEPSASWIRELICDVYGITIEQINIGCRKRCFTVPRHVLMYLLRKELKMSFTSISRFVCAKHHSSVYHAITAVEDLRATDQNFAARLNEIQLKLFKTN